ncbi:hypothetical protein SCP_1801460 [Sparassis crispa]|uniref:Uncharacterized protein n=1 Tax=Sparassis crispa TaxID=139825 RepID=A0A401H6T2_9APHY|nr:hypothetical protein SCP_1801460 [Sparassis crispa]GBE90122.1 hypothetical protein SCP_1801460 [Sparassis crispa]
MFTAITILHPSILILTKFKRWSVSHMSTRPKTVRKTASDRDDINFLIAWLAERNISIQFELYQGKTKVELLRMVRQFHGKYEERADLMEKLKSIMESEWEEMLSLLYRPEESTLPPID